MKGLKATSALVLLSFMVISQKAHAQNIPDNLFQPEAQKLQVEPNPNPDLTKDNENLKVQPNKPKEYQQVQTDLDKETEINDVLYGYLLRDLQVIELPTVAIAPNTDIKS